MPHCFFDINPVFRANKRNKSCNKVEDRMIHGTYRREKNLSDYGMILEVLHNIDAVFPYEAISKIERLADNPF